jgi:hypothetical protein
MSTACHETKAPAEIDHQTGTFDDAVPRTERALIGGLQVRVNPLSHEWATVCAPTGADYETLAPPRSRTATVLTQIFVPLRRSRVRAVRGLSGLEFSPVT